MVLQFTIDEGPGYLIVEIKGQWDQKGAEKIIDAICEAAIKRSHARIFIDTCGVMLPENDTTYFFTGKYAAKILGRPFKIAALKTRRLHKDSFAETVALNRGVNVKTFFDKEAALKWLLMD